MDGPAPRFHAQLPRRPHQVQCRHRPRGYRRRHQRFCQRRPPMSCSTSTATSTSPLDPTALAFYPITPCRIADTRKARATSADLRSPAGRAGRSQSSRRPPATFRPPRSPTHSTLLPSPRSARLSHRMAHGRRSRPVVCIAQRPDRSHHSQCRHHAGGQHTAPSTSSPVMPPTWSSISTATSRRRPPAACTSTTSRPAACSIRANLPDRSRSRQTRCGRRRQPLRHPVRRPGRTSSAPRSCRRHRWDTSTLWPQGQTQPVVSTLNALDGAITSNLAIVPTTDGSISAFASNLTHLVLDIFGYFAQ